jgi:hypothetical protein
MKPYEVMLLTVLMFIAINIQRTNTRTISIELPRGNPNIYIPRTDHILTFDGGEAWVLEYTVNGVLQTPVFDSQKAMTEYREYLDTIGNVYRKEGDNAE